ncbi:MAG TPA: bifunctional (p)ppGpp synthetase/guanosine-3',5'-bis(diphosphate) 3'-pyrophosphohydrolase [Acidobacteriota bacterium]|nr:bifunctional (p)ppGpp synthetase/guanosine-3',5'-bis(diphosphate) 3'-pyrophosphohydrolase [Acidobacteriota bacterium]
MIRYEELEEKVRKYQPSADLDLLRRAYLFSAREHKGQTRLSGEPYLTHPLEVAGILADMRLDVVCVSVGLLHDVVEDTLTTSDKIKDLFGPDVADLVEGVTKLEKIHFSTKHEAQAENFRKLLLAMVDDIRVILIKLADRLHNMRTLQHMPPEKRKAISRETLEIYAPIAHRLGMSKVRGELEDLAFSYLDPVNYQNIVAQVEEKKAHSDEFISRVTRRIERELSEHGIEAILQHRIKRIYSIAMKMKRQKIGLDQVYDFIAIRVLVDSVKDCYTVLGVINNMWPPVPGRIKDFIAMPRPNGYRSVHTTVVDRNGQPFEVQIRTHEMHRVAEEGIAAHYKYKEGYEENGKDDKRFQWLRRLLDWQHEVKDPHQFLSNLKIDLYPEEVYAFTPKGEIITLPRGATPVDFAYTIHTEVGHHCVGAKVNSRIVPLKYQLVNGERVEILTSKESRPSRDWLSFVKTSKARSSIRRWLNQEQKKKAVELGEKLLEKAARRYEVSLKQHEEELQELLSDYAASKKEDLLAAIGYGKVEARQILRRLEPDKVGLPAAEKEAAAGKPRKVYEDSGGAIQVKGHDDLMVNRAKCCNPIRGEEIVGYITVGRGITIHSTQCRNVENLLLNPERIIEVNWAGESGAACYPVRLRISTEDRTGILADIVSAIANVNTYIRSAKADTLKGRYGRIDVTVEVKDTRHLEKIINYLKTIKGVQEVERAKMPPRGRKSRSPKPTRRPSRGGTPSQSSRTN